MMLIVYCIYTSLAAVADGVVCYYRDIKLNIHIYIKGNIMKLTKEQILGIVRHALTFVGGIVVMKGLVDETLVTELIGGAMTLTGAIWSIINKK
jgi:hypothetical protein